MITVLSLGAGVQSSTLALMAAKGEITPMPDCAIFADTGAEPKAVYEYLDWLEKQLPFPVHRVMKGDGLVHGILSSAESGKRTANPPFFADTANGGGILRRKCTTEFKIEPIIKKVRDLMGLAKGERAKKGIQVIQYIGISTDEATRMKPSHEKYIQHRWPLIELGMNRNDCLRWIEKNGYKRPGKSACTFCPYHDDSLWRDMKLNDPDSFAEAVKIDKKIREGLSGTREKLYVHRSMKPLDEIDFRNAEDMGQYRMFNDECEGMCGT